jgi:hypothetical protein
MVRKPKELIDCPVCHKQPYLIKGTHNILHKKVFRVECVNALCTNPSTENVFTARHAKELWNNKVTTDCMFNRKAAKWN